jgi:hypothetical protein
VCVCVYLPGISPSGLYIRGFARVGLSALVEATRRAIRLLVQVIVLGTKKTVCQMKTSLVVIARVSFSAQLYPGGG